MLVLDHVEAFDRAVAPARRHHRNLALERHEGFEDLRLTAEIVEQRGRIAAVADHHLALAVIAEAPRLQHGRPPDLGERGREHARVNRPRRNSPCRCRAFHELLLGQPVLRGRQHLRIGQHRLARREERRGLGRHVLELVGDDIDVGGETVERRHVGVVGLGHAPHHIEGGRVRIGAQHMALEAEPRGGERQHAAELSAAEDADGGIAAERPALLDHASSSGRSATASVCCLRQASSRVASAASDSASTLAASSAALIAPALPIASVPTGTPGGICTME